jgi:acetyl esterase/lipase
MFHLVMRSRTMRSLRRAFAGAVILFATLAATGRAAEPDHPNLTYAVVGGRALQLDLYLPAGPGPHPVLVWIHGGGWSGGARYPAPAFVTDMREQGFAVAAVTYRLTSQAALFGGAPITFPAQIHDVKGAVRWLRANAAAYGLDPARFACWGTSAGGHLSALLATSGGEAAIEGTVGGNTTQSSAVQAFVDYFGPIDLLWMNEDVTNPPGSTIDHDAPNSPESRLMGWALDDVKAHLGDTTAPYPSRFHALDLASPAWHVDPADPPGFVAHGTLDTTVPHAQSLRLVNALTADGVAVEWRSVEGAGHGFLGLSTNEDAQAFLVTRLRPEALAVGGASAPPSLRAAPRPAKHDCRFTLAGSDDGPATIEVLDLAGRRVRAWRPDGAGTRQVTWDLTDAHGRRVGAGLYFVVARTAAGTAVQRLPVVR